MFELLVEFWEDHYTENPLEASRLADGRIQFKDTGDDLIDKWEEQLIDGERPDFMEGFSPEQIEKLNNLRTRGRSKHGHLVRGGTLKNAVDSATQDAIDQGLDSKLPYPVRFKDVIE